MSLSSGPTSSNVAHTHRKEVSTMQRLSFTFGRIALAISLTAPMQALAETGLGANTIAPSNLSTTTPFLDLLQAIINWILGLVGTVAVLMLIWGGFNYLTSAGNNETTKKAKQTITYAIIGMIIIAISYAMVTFVTGTLRDL